MSTRETRHDLDRAVDAVRDVEPPRHLLDAAADRVREALRSESGRVATPPSSRHIDRCAGFQALIPSYIDGSLPRDSALLLEDHTRECVPCRRAWMAARTPNANPAPVPGRRPRRLAWGLAAAAATVVLAAGSIWLAGPAPRHLQVLAVEGDLYRVTPTGGEAVLAGSVLREDAPLRTGKGSTAVVRLDDGSRVEIRERTRFSVDRRRDGATIRLDRGDIIVEASRQGSGHLDVRTGDCVASVHGTIFSVAAGTLGSRVAVIEGAVEVRTGGDARLLRPGEQTGSRPGLLASSVGEEIAWSRNASHYARLLEGMQALRRDLDAAIPSRALRHDTRLLDRSPDGTVFYAAIPNVSDAILSASSVIRENVRNNDALRAWWDARMGSPEAQARFEDALGRVARVGGHLGDEVAISLSLDGAGAVRALTLLAEVKDPEGFRRALREESRGAGIASRAPDGSITTEIRDGLFKLEAAPARTGERPAAAPSSFVGSDFHRRVAAAYGDGAGWVFAADLGAILHRAAPETKERTALETLGLLDARDIIVEFEEGPASTHRVATLGFEGGRRGLAAVLADPAPSGALEFVSPEASVAFAAVIEDPAAIARELHDALAASNTDTESPRDAMRRDLGVDPIDDLAAALGGDFAVAIDGPLLPVPSWKLAVEVDDPATLQRGIETLVGRLGDKIALTRTDDRGRAYYTVRFPTKGTELTYTYADGYLLAASQRALVDRAISQRAAGYALPSSSRFRDLLPANGRVNYSAVAYQNIGPALAPLAEAVGAGSSDASSLAAAAARTTPTLGVAYAEADRIVLVSDREGGLGANLASMLGANETEGLAILGSLFRSAGADRSEAAGAP